MVNNIIINNIKLIIVSHVNNNKIYYLMLVVYNIVSKIKRNVVIYNNMKI